MKKRIVFIIVLTFLMISVFSINILNDTSYDESLIEFDIKPVQEVLLPERAILIDANITKDNEELKDADEVYFEIKGKGSNNHTEASAINLKNGTYRIQTMFPKSGEYYLRATVKDGDLIKTSSEIKINVDKA
ncbi:FixH family protein [Cytobacillus purgationiresistens]|uniref:YtkA-like domain-containing protein n=1 Tax=Cytobacillus purgationiresistens TaxID=863449 RepID=A0ABU0ALK9_9BACI|nr:FixH family protein [Cytobacillus purgationiresistens]MDQ0272155.1 hypothetical protein [Cytobacillus purgationiresistens]